MCTVTWQVSDDGWLLLANRDEKHARLPAEPPIHREADGVLFLAPIDGDAGGTWVGVNEWGVGLCLLNGDSRRGEEGPGGFTSRGLLVLALLASSSPGRVSSALRAGSLDAYRGFRLLVLGRQEPPRVIAWDGRRLDVTEAGRPPLVSSARRAFQGAWQRQLATASDADEPALLAFHRSHEPARGPRSVCMHGPDASTVSLSRIRVHGSEAGFCYAAGPPCRTPSGRALRLALRA